MVSPGAKPTTLVVVLMAGMLLGTPFAVGAESEPWMTQDDWTGFISCAVTVQDPIYPCTLTDSFTDVTHEHTAAAQLMTLSLYLEWPGSSELQLAVEHEGMPWWTSGASPLELRIDAADGLWDPATYAHFTFTVSPTPVSFTYQQVFTLHYHLHYVEPAPDGYTAAP